MVVIVASVLFYLRPGGPRTTPRSQVPAAIQQQIDATAATAITTHDQAAACDPAIFGPTCTLHCVATVFAIDPQHATSVDRVTSAYANVHCAIDDPQFPDDMSIDVMAVHFTSPPTIIASPDDAHKTDLAKIFPAHALDAAWWYYTHY